MPRPQDHLHSVDDSPPAEGLVGESEGMKRLFQLLRVTADSDQPVLISGEVGTGKTRIATVLHQLSDRSEGPFFRVNCSAINDQQLVEELLDWFHEAHGGVLFFDEINATPTIFQAKLLQFLQSVRAGRMSSQENGPVNVRIMAAANCDLSKAVAEGTFREDLYWHLSVIPLEVPPLRRRKQDIEPLVRAALTEASHGTGQPVARIHKDALAALQAYPFPGNISELNAYIHRAAALTADGEITSALLPVAVTGDVQDAQAVVFRPSDDASLVREFVYSQLGQADPDDLELYKRVVGPVEKELLIQILEACNQTQTKAAKRLGINRNTLYKKMVEFELAKPKPEKE